MFWTAFCHRRLCFRCRDCWQLCIDTAVHKASGLQEIMFITVYGLNSVICLFQKLQETYVFFIILLFGGGGCLNICPSLPFDVGMTSPLHTLRSQGLHTLSTAGGVWLCQVGDVWRSLYSTAFAMQNILSAELALPCYRSVVVELMRNFLICLSYRIIKRRRGGEEGGRALDSLV